MPFSLKSSILRASLLLGITAPLHAAAAPSVIAHALADPSRMEDRAQDARRHPAELVALAHVASGQAVLDLIPGGGYWTRIFSRIVGPTGHVYAVWPNA